MEISSIRPDGIAQYGTGTSSATALVSGVVALIRARFPDASAHEVVTRLLATAQDLGSPGRDDDTGYGLVRPYEALTAEVPASAPNPIYQGLDLTDVADPGPPDLGFTPPSAPSLPPPPIAASDGPKMTPLMALLAFACVGLVVAVMITGLLLVRTGRRRSPPPPGTTAPPPGVPAGPPGESRPGSWSPPPG